MVLRWTPERLDQLEHAIRNGRRIAVSRRGNEYIVIADRLTTIGNRDGFIGRVPMTGDEMTFALDEVDGLAILA